MGVGWVGREYRDGQVFIAQPENYVYSASLWLVLSLLLLGLNAAAFYLTDVFGKVEKLGAEEDVPISAKLVAASGLLLWFAVVAFGRYIQPLAGSGRSRFGVTF